MVCRREPPGRHCGPGVITAGPHNGVGGPRPALVCCRAQRGSCRPGGTCPAHIGDRAPCRAGRARPTPLTGARSVGLPNVVGGPRPALQEDGAAPAVRPARNGDRAAPAGLAPRISVIAPPCRAGRARPTPLTGARSVGLPNVVGGPRPALGIPLYLRRAGLARPWRQPQNRSMDTMVGRRFGGTPGAGRPCDVGASSCARKSPKSYWAEIFNSLMGRENLPKAKIGMRIACNLDELVWSPE